VVAALNLRTKLVVVFAALALLPLLAVVLVQYRAGASAVEALLRERASSRASRAARDVDHVLSVQGSLLSELARADAVRLYVGERAPRADAGPPPGDAPAPAAAPTPADGAGPAAREAASASVAELLDAYTSHEREYLQSLTVFDSSRQPVFRLNRSGNGERFERQTSNFLTGQGRHDERVWEARGGGALRSPLSGESFGAAVRLTAPVFSPAAAGEGGAVAGALVAEVRLGEVVRDAGQAEGEKGGARARRSLVALDNTGGTVVYHTNEALCHQTASNAMPYFERVAARMKAGEAGADFYDEPDGGLELTAFRQAEGLGLSLAASEDYAGAVAPVRRAALLGGGLAVAAGLGGLGLLSFIAGRDRRGVGRVARGASAIAAGDLDQRIEISSSGETRELAENFNAMTERLREMIAREAESRQFASFMRISAMVSHDLKNAIAGLSMLVSNMEKQFHREEFRADAIESLREATEKLKRTVARLSEPAKSLSGEYRIAARPTDLVPVIRRVLATNAEPTRPLNEVEARLPERLVATVEPGRIENVVENLVINALEAMGAKGGRLTVEAGEMSGETGEYVFFSVADTGVGMEEEFVRRKLFRPFATTKNKGIGLGLFTCKEVVEAHGGRLEVQSAPGAGTRFRVVLPSRLFHSGERRERPLKAAAAAESAPPGSSR
jgi:signal transduction histidine kinase